MSKEETGSRGAYLLWLDTRIKEAIHDGGLSSEVTKALQAARKQFTDEFYPN